MVSNSGAEVSSKSLIDLQSNLIALSNNLKELYDVLHDNRSKLSEEWRDEKYDEFADEFEQKTERVISELSEKYSEWANIYLPPRIEAVIAVEGSNVTIGGTSGMSAASGTHASVVSTASGTSSSENAEKFRRGTDRLKAKMNSGGSPAGGGPTGGTGGFGQNERERFWSLINQKTR